MSTLSRHDLSNNFDSGAAPRVGARKNRFSFLISLKERTGLDRAVLFTVLSRFWVALAGVLTVLLIARFLTPTEQGFYYTFYSIVALNVVFELGFTFVILQLSAHESARLTFLPDGRVEGDAVAHSRLASVLQHSVRWYSIAALLMLAALLPGGLYFFGAHQQGGTVAWRAPWCLLVIASAIRFQIDPVISFVEGCGFVRQVAQMMLGQNALASLLAWGAMASHHGLFAPAMLVFGQAIAQVIFLSKNPRRRLLTRLLSHPTNQDRVSWEREIWPFQWRIAITWLCSYFISQLFNPVLFVYQGAQAAGRMGMSLSIATSIGTLGMAWMSTKASPFGSMVARNEIGALDRLFFQTLRQSTLLLASGATAFFLALVVGAYMFPQVAGRVLPPWAFALLLLTTLMNHITFCQALYLRAHKREPFLKQALLVAALLTVSTFLLGRTYGANAVTVGYFVIAGVLGLGLATCIFTSKRREWHGSAMPDGPKEAVSVINGISANQLSVQSQ